MELPELVELRPFFAFMCLWKLAISCRMSMGLPLPLDSRPRLSVASALPASQTSDPASTSIGGGGGGGGGGSGGKKETGWRTAV